MVILLYGLTVLLFCPSVPAFIYEISFALGPPSVRASLPSKKTADGESSPRRPRLLPDGNREPSKIWLCQEGRNNRRDAESPYPFSTLVNI